MSNTEVPHNYSGDVSDVRIIAELDPQSIYHRLWQPYVANLGNDHLVTCYGAEFRGKVDMGDICASVSEDGGNSWHPSVFIFDHRNLVGNRHYGYLNPSFIRPEGTDTLWCFATRCPMYKLSGDDNELVAAYTVDGGWSWQEIPLACDFSSPLITCNAPVPIQSDGHTRYLMPVHRGPFIRGDTDADQKAFLLESSDLLHWKIGAYTRFDESDPIFLAEGSLVQRKDGTLTIVYTVRRSMDHVRHYQQTETAPIAVTAVTAGEPGRMHVLNTVVTTPGANPGTLSKPTEPRSISTHPTRSGSAPDCPGFREPPVTKPGVNRVFFMTVRTATVTPPSSRKMTPAGMQSGIVHRICSIEEQGYASESLMFMSERQRSDNLRFPICD